jgi:hypothetical protein
VRYVDVRITDPVSGNLIQPPFMQGTGVQSAFTTFLPSASGGQSIPGALDMELDFPVTSYDTPWFGARLSVWGIGIKEITQSFNLNGCNIEIRAGMKPGLPLATAASQNNQAGLILSGSIFQSYGSWVGNQMRLDLILQPPTGGGQYKTNLQFNCPANQPMSQAIKQCITTALPGYTVNVAISPQFVFNYPQTANYDKLSSLANWVKRVSKSQQFNGIKTQTGIPYSTNGVSITITGKNVLVFDGTVNNGISAWTTSNPRAIAFQDMIGQPTFIDPVSINFKTVMRGDLAVGDYIMLPQKLAAPYVIIAPGAGVPNTPARNTSVFQGLFFIKGLHHFGHLRQASGDAWCTTIDAVICNPQPSGGTATAAAIPAGNSPVPGPPS